MKVTLAKTTNYGRNFLPAGSVVEIDDATAARWKAKGIAKPDKIEVPDVPELEIIQPEDDLETLTIVELRKKGYEQGLTNVNRMKKAELIDALGR